ncbi:hypothetical protein SAMN05443582_1021002 [Phyllobacterium sp. OV277]|nr:hypothetical protein SAMN05443582_1021002 [Phyllobacterium sp. OV277]
MVRGSWFDKLTMRERGDATIITEIAELGSLQSSHPLILSLSKGGTMVLQQASPNKQKARQWRAFLST